MAFRKVLLLLVICFLLVACSHATPATLVPTLANAQTVVGETVAPSFTKQPTSDTRSLNYKIVFDQGNFQIREAFLGLLDTWDWQRFSMPAARIPRGSDPQSFESDYDYDRCYKEVKTIGQCTITIKMVGVKDQRPIEFNLITNDLGAGGHYLLLKNGSSVWEGDLFGGTWFAIHRLARIGDELAIDTLISGTQKIRPSILLTQGNSAVDIRQATEYDGVFYPCELEGKLVYFAQIFQPQIKDILVFDGQGVGPVYDKIFNLYCCWDGPPIQIASNGKTVDFFALRDTGFYHVQAGNLAGLK